MKFAEINLLKRSLQSNKAVFWQPYSIAPAIRVSRIELGPHPDDGELLYLITGGNFLQLSHCQLSEFFIGTPLERMLEVSDEAQ